MNSRILRLLGEQFSDRGKHRLHVQQLFDLHPRQLNNIFYDLPMGQVEGGLEEEVAVDREDREDQEDQEELEGEAVAQVPLVV